MRYYINVFFVYSMLGFLLETTLKTFFFPSMNNGILYGPWIPVYGFGACIIISITNSIFKHKNIPSWLKLFITFMSVFFLLSILEFLGGIVIEYFFHQTFWDYRDWHFHFGPYISLEMSTVWGTLSLFLLYFIKPWMDLLIKKIPKSWTLLIFFLFLIDVSITFLSIFDK